MAGRADRQGQPGRNMADPGASKPRSCRGRACAGNMADPEACKLVQANRPFLAGYRVKLETLGSGAHGYVSTVVDRKGGEEYAGKKFCVNDRDAVHELTITRAASNASKHVVRVHEVVKADRGTGFVLIMEKMGGGSLQGKTLQMPALRSMAYQALCALRDIHAAGIVHCDVKPANFVRASTPAADQEYKLCDFGIARKFEGDVYASRARDGAMVVTLWYRAPELLWADNGKPTYGAGVDTWALGCTLAELLTGEVLFRATDAKAMLDLIYRRMPPDTAIKARRCDELRKILRGTDEHADFVDLLADMLEPAADRRITPAQAIEHQWFHTSRTRKRGQHE